MYFKRITRKEDLHPNNYIYAQKLVEEVDPLLKLDFTGYDWLLENPEYFYFELYENTNNLNNIGFTAFFVMKHFYATRVMAMHDNCYLDPKYRGYYGGRMIIESENIAREEGADEFWWSPHPNTAMENCFKRNKKYIPGGVTYIRSLK